MIRSVWVSVLLVMAVGLRPLRPQDARPAHEFWITHFGWLTSTTGMTLARSLLRPRHDFLPPGTSGMRCMPS